VAFGFGSNKSRWLGPPPSHTSKIDLAFGASARAESPAKPVNGQAKGTVRAARTNSRRLGPWQARVGQPTNLNMTCPPGYQMPSAISLKCTRAEGHLQGVTAKRSVGPTSGWRQIRSPLGSQKLQGICRLARQYPGS